MINHVLCKSTFIMQSEIRLPGCFFLKCKSFSLWYECFNIFLSLTPSLICYYQQHSYVWTFYQENFTVNSWFPPRGLHHLPTSLMETLQTLLASWLCPHEMYSLSPSTSYLFYEPCYYWYKRLIPMLTFLLKIIFLLICRLHNIMYVGYRIWISADLSLHTIIIL